MIVRDHRTLGAGTITNSKSYAPSELVRVFDAAWKVIRHKGRHSLKPQETRRRLHLARCVIALAESGVKDAKELRRQAIEQFLLGDEPDGSMGDTPFPAMASPKSFEPSKNSN